MPERKMVQLSLKEARLKQSHRLTGDYFVARSSLLVMTTLRDYLNTVIDGNEKISIGIYLDIH